MSSNQPLFRPLKLFVVVSITALVNVPLAPISGAISQNQTSDDNRATILGQPCKNSYVVAIPTSSPTLLDTVQSVLPTAFLTRSHLGLYVQAGSFSEFQAAEHLNHQIRQWGLDARVIYKPVRCPPQVQLQPGQ